MRITIVLFVCLCLVSPITAGADTPVNGIGKGVRSCGSFIELERAHRPRLQLRKNIGLTYVPEVELYMEWARGYVTSTNEERSQRGEAQIDVDSDGMLVWLRNYCSRNPTKVFAIAVGALVEAH